MHYNIEHFCKHCSVYKRPDIYHCDDGCDVCVEGYDHHCGVIGICVGDFNFKYFLQMIGYSALNCFAFAFSLFTASKSFSDDAMIILPYVVVGFTLTCMFFSFFTEMLNPEVSGMEVRIVYDKIDKKVP